MPELATANPEDEGSGGVQRSMLSALPPSPAADEGPAGSQAGGPECPGPMPLPDLAPEPPLRALAHHHARRAPWVLGAGGACLAAAILLPASRLAWALGILGGAALLLSIALALLAAAARRRRAAVVRAVIAHAEAGHRAAFLSDGEGDVLYRNAPAEAALGAWAGEPGATLSCTGLLGRRIADPRPLVYRLLDRAALAGRAREEVATARGDLALEVNALPGGRFYWQLEELGAAPRPRGEAALMTTGPTGTVLYMNDAARRLAGTRVKSLDRFVEDLPLRSGEVHRLATASGTKEMRIVVSERPGGRRDLQLLPLEGEAATLQEPDMPGAAVPRAPVRPVRQAERAPERFTLRAADGDGGPGHPAPPAAASENGIAAGERIEAATLFDTLPVPLLRLAPDGAVRLANRQARSLLGRQAEGARLEDLLQGLGRPIDQWLEDASMGRGLGKPELLRARRRDQEVFVQVTLQRAEPAPTTATDESDLLAVLSDATELKTLEAQFVQSQKMQAVGQLAGGVAHDFNNLLTAISGHCDLLLLRHDPGDQDYGDLTQIHQNANRAASLVGQLLAFSRKQTMELEHLDIRETLSDLGHLLNRLVGERIELTLSHDPALAHVRADKRQLEQVLMNLVVNARDAMPDGGEVHIATENRRLAEPHRRDRATIPAGEYVVIRVTDQGCGIAADDLPKIFEPFFTTKRTGEGTGLGLSTAYGIVKQSGGFIFADSVPGHGTTFTLYLPAREPGPAPRPAPDAPPVAAEAPGEGVVLLVEDEGPVRAFASRALRLRGYTVIEAETAEAALETLSDPTLTVDLFVTDVIMPGMDGPTWVREALRDRPDVKVIFVSGYAEESFAQMRRDIPNSVFLPKPFSLSDLTATVHRQLS